MTRARGLRVLVASDPAGAEALVGALRAEGHEVDVAADRAAAAAAPLPDVAFLDAGLPEGGAAALARDLSARSAWRRPLLIALADAGHEPACEKCLAEFDLRLVKPLPLAALGGLLRRFQAIVRDMEGFDPGL